MKQFALKRLFSLMFALIVLVLMPMCITSADNTVSGEDTIDKTVMLAAVQSTDISGLRATIPYLNYSFTGAEIKPVPTLKYNGVKLIEGKDYTVSYSNNIRIGELTAKVTMTGIGKYTGTTSRQFNITPRSVSSCTVKGITDAYYNGKAIKQNPTVEFGTYKFANGTDYTLSFSDNTASGTATVIITGKNKLKGTKKITFKIKPWNVVTDFGAKSSGSSDSYYAFYKALVQAKTMPSGEKLEVYVPAGKYYISKTLGIYSNTRLILDSNAEIINSTDNKTLLSVMGNNGSPDGFTGYSEAHDITIEGGTWNGNGTTKTQARGIMVFRNSKNITIKNTKFVKVYGSHYLICDGISDLVVSGCSFKDYVAYKGSWKDYDFTKYTTDAESRKNNIGAVEAVHLDFADDKTPCKNVKVYNCTFDDVPAGIGTHHINKQRAENIQVYNNTFKNIWFSCFHASSYRSVKMYNNKATNTGLLFRSEDSYAEVYNNTFTGLSKIDPDRYNMGDTIYAVLSMTDSKLDFHNNDLKNIIGSGMLIVNNGKLETTIRDNSITNCSLNGMYIGNSAVNITYNTISSCKRNGISAGNSKVSCTHNNILKCGVSFIYLSDGCYDSYVYDNGITAGLNYGVSPDSNATVMNNQPSISGFKATIPYASYTYKGTAIKPKVTVKNGTTKLSTSDYSVTYQNNVKVGTATILIEGKGQYRGFIKKTFVVKPAPGELKLTASSGAFKAYWPQDTSASGYMFKYSKDKNFKTGVYTYTISDNKKTSVNFSSKPKSGETWYIKYRAFVTVNGSKYGNYSTVKSIKVK